MCRAQVAHQGPAVLGIALVAMAEDLGASMAHRALEHLLQYGEPAARCAACYTVYRLTSKHAGIPGCMRAVGVACPHNTWAWTVPQLSLACSPHSEQRCLCSRSCPTSQVGCLQAGQLWKCLACMRPLCLGVQRC